MFIIKVGRCSILVNFMSRSISVAYSEPSQISEMELFAKIVNDFQPSIIFTKIS